MLSIHDAMRRAAEHSRAGMYAEQARRAEQQQELARRAGDVRCAVILGRLVTRLRAEHARAEMCARTIGDQSGT